MEKQGILRRRRKKRRQNKIKKNKKRGGCSFRGVASAAERPKKKDKREGLGGRGDTEGQRDTITIHMLGRRSPFRSR